MRSRSCVCRLRWCDQTVRTIRAPRRTAWKSVLWGAGLEELGYWACRWDWGWRGFLIVWWCWGQGLSREHVPNLRRDTTEYSLGVCMCWRLHYFLGFYTWSLYLRENLGPLLQLYYNCQCSRERDFQWPSIVLIIILNTKIILWGLIFRMPYSLEVIYNHVKVFLLLFR